MLGVHGPTAAVIPTSLCSVSLQLETTPPHTHTLSSQKSCCFNRHATLRQHYQYLYIPSMCSFQGSNSKYGNVIDTTSRHTLPSMTTECHYQPFPLSLTLSLAKTKLYLHKQFLASAQQLVGLKGIMLPALLTTSRSCLPNNLIWVSRTAWLPRAAPSTC